MKTENKITRYLVTLIVIVGLFAALSTLSFSQTTNSKFHIKGMPKHPTIVFATYLGQSLSGLRYAAKNFYKQTGIHVSVQGMPYASYKMWIKAQFLSENPPELFMIDNSTGLIFNYGASGLLYRLNTALKKKNPFLKSNKPWKDVFIPTPLQTAQDINGNYWAVPYTSYIVTFLYNKKLFRKYGIKHTPKTWKQFINIGLKIKREGGTAYGISFKWDAQINWVGNILLDTFLRAKIPAINLVHAKGWKFNAYNPKSTIGEKISLSERIVAFNKGIINPATSPVYRKVAEMLKQFSTIWWPSYAGSNGAIVWNSFNKGKTAMYFEGTWGLTQLTNTQNVMRILKKKSAFHWGAFPFPNVINKKFVTAGEVDQNSNMREGIMLTKSKQKWKNKAGLLFLQYITTPKIASQVFEHSSISAIPAIYGVKVNKLVKKVQFVNKYATFHPFIHIGGYDAQASHQFYVECVEYFSGKLTTTQFLNILSKHQKASLKRLAKIYYKQLNIPFLKKELGKDYNSWITK